MSDADWVGDIALVSSLLNTWTQVIARIMGFGKEENDFNFILTRKLKQELD